MEEKQFIKLKLTFDGWHCLSKRQTNDILKKARTVFRNANFIENRGLLIETDNETEVLKFSLLTLKVYNDTFRSWDGYELKRLSKKIFFNYDDRKRKLKLDYFKKITKENLNDTKLILAGILYLEPDEIKNLLLNAEKDFDCLLKDMEDEELEDVYRILIMYASSKDRNFSINR